MVLCGCTRMLKVTSGARQSLEMLSVVATRDRVFRHLGRLEMPEAPCCAGWPQQDYGAQASWAGAWGRECERVRWTSPGRRVRGSLVACPSCPSFLCSCQQKFEFLLCAPCRALR